MGFQFPPRIHVLRNIQQQHCLLGLHYHNNSYILAMLYDRDAIYISRTITDNVVSNLENFQPDHPDQNLDVDTSILLLHDKIKLTVSKEASPHFHWTIDSMDTMELMRYPRHKYLGLIMPTEKIGETPDMLEYHALVIEPIMDPTSFQMNIS